MTKTALKLVKVSFGCDPAVLEGLRWLAEARSTTTAELLRGFTRRYVLHEIRSETEDLIVLNGIGTDKA